MPTFGDYETTGEPLATTEGVGHFSQIWLARKSDGTDSRLYALKLYTPRQIRRAPQASETMLEEDRALQFLEGVKQIKKAQSEGGKAGICLTPIHEFGKTPDGNAAWYVTDFYGEPEPFLPRSLQSYIIRGGRLDGEALRNIIHNVVSGCLALQKSRNFSHGNLKSSNVFRVGKSRPLRKAVLQLADAFPAAPVQLASLDASYRDSIGELLQQTMEVQDLRAIGVLILQLVEGRLITTDREYDYPAVSSPAWERLGKDAERWLEICNRLLDPSLSIEQVNLLALEKEFRPSAVNKPMIAASVALVCLVFIGAFFFFGWRKKQIHFQTQPQTQAQYVGGIAEFSAKVSGAQPMSYQWRRNGAEIPGATSQALTKANLTLADGGSYDVVASNQYTSVTSDAAALTVNPPVPQIAAQPASQTRHVGENATFTLSASSPYPLSYQWRKGGKTLDGETRSTLVLTNLTLGQAGDYDVALSNQYSSVISSSAALSVNLQALQIAAQPRDQTITNGAGAVFTVNATGAPPLKYQWRYNGNPIPEATGSSLTLTRTAVVNSGSYTVTISSPGGAADSRVAVLTVLPSITPPQIVDQPQNQTVTSGGSASFTVTATGTSPLKYQWSRNGNLLSGVTASTLTLTRLTEANAGSYTVTVSNSGGMVQSRPAVLTVQPAIVAPQIVDQPQSQTITSGGSASFTVTATGTSPLKYQWSRNGNLLSGVTASTLTLTRLTEANAGSYTVTVSNSGGMVQSRPAVLTVQPAIVAPQIVDQPQSQTITSGGSASFTVTATGTSPLKYQWSRNGNLLSGVTASTLTLTRLTEANAGNYTVTVSNSGGMVQSRPAVLTVQPAIVAPQIVDQPQNQTITSGDSASFTVTATGTSSLKYQWSRNGNLLSGVTASTLTLTRLTEANAGSYTVTVSNSGGAVESRPAILTVQPAIIAPRITIQPQSQTITNGGAATLTVGTGGTSPLQYQWRRNGNAISGATTNSVTASAAGSYDVTVSNGAGSVASLAATITVRQLPPAQPVQPPEFKVQVQAAQQSIDTATNSSITNLVAALDHINKALALVPAEPQASRLKDRIVAAIGTAFADALRKGSQAVGQTNLEEAVKQRGIAARLQSGDPRLSELSSNIFNTALFAATNAVEGTPVNLDEAERHWRFLQEIDPANKETDHVKSLIEAYDTQISDAAKADAAVINGEVKTIADATNLINALNGTAVFAWRPSDTNATSKLVRQLEQTRSAATDSTFNGAVNSLQNANIQAARNQLEIFKLLAPSDPRVATLETMISSAATTKPQVVPPANASPTSALTNVVQRPQESQGNHPPINLFGMDFVWVKGMGARGAGAYVEVNELSWGDYAALGGKDLAKDPRDSNTTPANFPTYDTAGQFAGTLASTFGSKGFSVRLPTLHEYLIMSGVLTSAKIDATDMAKLVAAGEHIEDSPRPFPADTTKGTTNQNGLRDVIDNVREWTSDKPNPFGIPYYVPRARGSKPPHNDLNRPPPRESNPDEPFGLRLVLEPAGGFSP